MRTVRLPILSLLFLAMTGLGACGVGTGTPPNSSDAGGNEVAADAGGNPVELGTGGEGFASIADGESLTIVAGPQGGFHLWAAARVYPPINPKNLSMRFRVLLDGKVQSNNEWKLSLVQNGEAYEWYGLTEVLDDPDAVRGQEVEFRLDVTDADGRTGSDSRRIIPVGP